MSSAQIDHIVFAVHDLDAAAADCERLGFVATPRAHHPFGTDNRLIQFEGRNFIELVEIARPELIADHRMDRDPPGFSFGAFNREFLKKGQGMSMLVLASTDAGEDHARFKSAGLTIYEKFGFERKAPQADGTSLDVAFELAFTGLPDVDRAGFFTCHNKFPENFWKPEFQMHANQASAITEVILVVADPEVTSQAAAGYAGSSAEPVDGGYRIDCSGHGLTLLTQEAAQERLSGVEGTGNIVIDDSGCFVAARIETGSLAAIEARINPGDRPRRSLDGLLITPPGLGGTHLEFVQA